MSERSAGDGALLTVPELANWLRLKPSTIYAWAEAGRLPCVRLGGRLRFVRGDVLRWIDARREG
jgi:excisionase family DNA binding protein